LLEGGSVWDAVLDAEPVPGAPLSDAALDAVLRAAADFVDLKSPYTVGHSAGVGELAGVAAIFLGLPAADAVAVRRAGYVHDLGRVAVSAGIWGKPGPLSRGEWEQVRLHPYYTERALARPAALAELGALAGVHHERMDGSGYHRGAPAVMLTAAARVLAVADTYHALGEPRPHREPYAAAPAADVLRSDARAGLLDADAVEAVLEAAGQRPRQRRGRVAGLTPREIEVLRLAARGSSIRQIAATLVIAPKTVDAHLQHVYTKIGVSTRAAATVYAMQHDLIDPTAGST
jgi:HD-GYP domain-containing protein (c-di-GMP phosphodiesterase class II)